MKKPLLAAALALATVSSHSQHSGYAGQQQRDIKALSAEEVSQYLSGAGMGYAKAAELNGFPGPMHALELSDRLGLSDTQRAATRRLMDEHKADARRIGFKLVEAEAAVEELFRRGDVDPAVLAQSVRNAAALQGEYRLAHLETHRRMRALLSEEQVKRYDALRGYSSPGTAHPHRH
ncbi:MAG TPA: Spy/CpxP family protein refolding chaperone [Burkholderiales bacterium]|nr:Spy/CpxP family protein refolding chaperone [Burkholderiales bacterium]